MAYTMGYALFGALLTTLALVPGLAYYAFRKPGHVYHNRWLERLTIAYDRMLAACIEQPRIIYGVVIFALLAVIGLGGTVGRDFLPDLDEGALWLQVQMPTGLALNKASDMASDLRRAILKYPEVSYVVTQTGRNDDGTDPWTMSHIEAPVGLEALRHLAGGRDQEAVRRSARHRAHQGSAGLLDRHQPADHRRRQRHDRRRAQPAGHQDLRRRSGRAAHASASRSSTCSTRSRAPPAPRSSRSRRFRRSRSSWIASSAARYGINMTDVQNVIQTGVGQAPVSTVYVGEKTYPLTVRFTDASRNQPEALGNLSLNTSSGVQVPLSQVADVRLRVGESTVTRENGQRNLTIRIDNRDRDLTSYLNEAQAKIAAQVHFDPNKIRFEWGGQFENQRRAESRLLVILGIVMVTMLILLTVGTGSVRQAGLILGVVPLATLGGLISLHLTGQTLNVASGVGFIALFGVAVQNGIIMVANLNRMRKSGLELHEAIMKGATERLRPVLMTATVATLGMLPAAIHTGVGSDVQRGIATVVVGGLAIATVLTLFVLPSMYHVIEHWAEHRRGEARWGA